MNPSLRRAIAALALLALAACTGQYGTKHTVGTLAGAGLGGLAGATIVRGKGRLAATAAGTLLGAFLGNAAGTSLDRADEVYASRAETQALETSPTGSAIPWRNPDTGSTGTITPLATYESSGSYCREFQHNAKIGGQSQQVYGTACRSTDGQWQVVN
jgi:surface antigen